MLVDAASAVLIYAASAVLIDTASAMLIDATSDSSVDWFGLSSIDWCGLSSVDWCGLSSVDYVASAVLVDAASAVSVDNSRSTSIEVVISFSISEAKTAAGFPVDPLATTAVAGFFIRRVRSVPLNNQKNNLQYINFELNVNKLLSFMSTKIQTTEFTKKLPRQRLLECEIACW